jgi:nucleotide-binding universal stress UspA family protein
MVVIKKILIPIDGRGLREHIVKYVARAFPSAKFYVISVVNAYEKGISFTDLLQKEMTLSAEKAIEKAKKILYDEGINDISNKVLFGVPSKAIVKYAKINDVDLIVLYVDSSKAAISYNRMGSTVRGVIKDCTMPVMTITEECCRIPIKNILFPTDGTRKSQMAKHFALLFSYFYKTELEVLHVLREGEDKKNGDSILSDIEWKASFLQVKVKKSLEKGDVIEEILDHSKNNDIIIMGIEKKFLLWHILGNITQTIVTRPSIPVILVHYFKKGRYE